MPYVKDIVTNKSKPVLTVCCYKTFWRRRWCYYLLHGDGRTLNKSKQTYATVKEMMRDIAIVRGKNNWPVEFAHSTISAEQLADIQREIADSKIQPKK